MLKYSPADRPRRIWNIYANQTEPNTGSGSRPHTHTHTHTHTHKTQNNTHTHTHTNTHTHTHTHTHTESTSNTCIKYPWDIHFQHAHTFQTPLAPSSH